MLGEVFASEVKETRRSDKLIYTFAVTDKDSSISIKMVKSKEELVDAFYSPEKDRKSIAAFSVSVSLAAEKGDEAALYILRNQAELLSFTAKALVAEMPEKPYAFLYGGVFQHSEIFRNHFSSLMGDCVSSCELTAREPVYGACIAARELIL